MVFSTYVEMILRGRDKHDNNHCILHVCGDDPRVTDVLTVAAKYSPRMWR